MQTLNSKNKRHFHEAMRAFDEFSVIKPHADKNARHIAKYSSQTYENPNSRTVNNTFCLKESSMQTDNQSPTMLKAINNDI